MGHCLEQTQELDRARQVFMYVLRCSRNNTDALLGMAKLQFRAAQFDELRVTTRRILNKGTNVSQEYLNALALWADRP